MKGGFNVIEMDKRHCLELIEEVYRLKREVREARFGMWVALVAGMTALFLSIDVFFRCMI